MAISTQFADGGLSKDTKERSLKSTEWALISLTLLAGPAFAGVSLKGAGSYLSAPLYEKWLEAYHRIHPEIKLKYEIKSSTDAANQWVGRGADFGATDNPLNADQEKRAMGRTVLHLPVALEAVAITYNLPGVPSGIKLSPKAISGLFMGTIKKWNDPAITEMNPGIPFPNMDVFVIHRGEESSLQDLFPGYLAQLDPQWTLKREKEKNLKWPVGSNIKSNERIYQKIRLWPGVIAAVNFSFAAENHLPMAQLKNASGNFVLPSTGSILSATLDFLSLPEDLQIHLGRSKVKEAYPLCTLSWMLVYQDYGKVYHDHDRGQALVDFLNWVLSDGQTMESDLSFVPLPGSFLSQVKQAVDSIKY